VIPSGKARELPHPKSRRPALTAPKEKDEIAGLPRDCTRDSIHGSTAKTLTKPKSWGKLNLNS
jgi:hypothetical protein